MIVCLEDLRALTRREVQKCWTSDRTLSHQCRYQLAILWDSRSDGIVARTGGNVGTFSLGEFFSPSAANMNTILWTDVQMHRRPCKRRYDCTCHHRRKGDSLDDVCISCEHLHTYSRHRVPKASSLTIYSCELACERVWAANQAVTRRRCHLHPVPMSIWFAEYSSVRAVTVSIKHTGQNLELSISTCQLITGREAIYLSTSTGMSPSIIVTKCPCPSKVLICCVAPIIIYKFINRSAQKLNKTRMLPEFQWLSVKLFLVAFITACLQNGWPWLSKSKTWMAPVTTPVWPPSIRFSIPSHQEKVIRRCRAM